MIPILVGKTDEGKSVYLDPELRKSSHMILTGASGRGKSKLLELLLRQDIEAGHTVCLIDWHGTLYKDVLRYCAGLGLGQPRFGIPDHRSVVLIDPSEPNFITGYNPFVSSGEDVSTEVNWRISATIRPWGGSSTNDMPTFERIARLFFTFMAETGQTLPNAAMLLDPEQSHLRDYAARITQDPYIRSQWRRLQTIKTLRDWEEKVLSTENRLSRFIGSKGVRRFMGLRKGNVDLMDVMDGGKVLLLNLGASAFLDRDAARVFASLLVYEFMQKAMLRANRSQMGEKPKPVILYLDEFQEYIHDDIAAGLEQARKGGLHFVLAHQHMAQLIKDGDERLKDSILTNCRIKAIFGGLPHASAEEFANEMFLPDLNARQIKETYEHTVHTFEEETRVQKSRSRSDGVAVGSNWSHATGTTLTHGTSHGLGTSSTQGSSTASSSGSSDDRSVSRGRGHSEANGRTLSPGLSPGSRTRSETMSDSRAVTRGESTSHSESRTESNSTSSSSFSTESESQSETKTDSHGASITASESETHGETIVPFLRPVARREKTSDVEWSLEEKRARIAEKIVNQPVQRCFLKLDTAPTESLTIESVRDFVLSEDSLAEYKRVTFDSQGALPAAEVDRQIDKSQLDFQALARKSQVDSAEPGLPDVTDDAGFPALPSGTDKRPRLGRGQVRSKSPSRKTNNPFDQVLANVLGRE